MPQPCNSRRLVLTLERATDSVVEISSAGNGCGERKSRACTWATVRLIPHLVPISPQWRMNFWATGVSPVSGDLIGSLNSRLLTILDEFARSAGCGFRSPAPDQILGRIGPLREQKLEAVVLENPGNHATAF